jgi:molecular chaperone GrpE (heat shock protein)
MRNQIAPKISKWPFFLGDALLLGLAAFIIAQTKLPMGGGEVLACVSCVAAGGVLAVMPFLLEYRALVKFAETDGLTDVVSQITNLEKLAAQIGSATAQWQTVQETAEKTAKTAKEMAQDMAAEAKGFQEFMERANDSEKATLRLEVEKLRRAEMEWLQVLVRMLDHTYALAQAAARARQPGVAEQLNNFQNACRDAARRVGLTPFVAASAEPFDEARHRVVEGDAQAAQGATIEETVATGYTFQGKLLRPALVRLQNGNGHVAEEPEKAEIDQSQLPLEATKPD